MTRFLYAFVLFVGIGSTALGCPFCSALALSFQAELAQVDRVAIAICSMSASPEAELPVCSFTIKKVLQGSTDVATKAKSPLEGRIIEAYAQAPFSVGESTLIYGSGSADDLTWAPLEPMSEKALSYAERIVELRRLTKRNSHEQSDNSQWMNFYCDRLVSEDSWVSSDAYNALAAASIEEMRQWARGVEPGEMKRRIANHRTSLAHRRFYWTVLSLCGTNSDLGFAYDAIFHQLSQYSRRPIGTESIGLDAAISCYLLLGGTEALEIVERELLRDTKRNSADRYATISALRIHAEEFEIHDNARICRALSVVLDDPEFADMVIPDLARLQDWSFVSALCEKFSDPSTAPAVRVPIIRYLRACPLAEAKVALEECKTLDPDAFQRAATIFPIGRSAARQ